MLEDAASYLNGKPVRMGIEAGPPAVELDRDVPPITKQWAPHEYETGANDPYRASRCQSASRDLLQPIVQLLVPFARECRRRFIQTGYVSFDGLVARARGLLRDHLVVRRELKTHFRSILVDEFQETRPRAVRNDSLSGRSARWRRDRLASDYVGAR